MRVIRSSKAIWKKIIYFLVLELMVISSWLGLMLFVYRSGYDLLYSLGILDKQNVSIVLGTSMLPNIKDGEYIQFSNQNKYEISRGDIVVFSNGATDGKRYIKRVIGLPGESLMISNGFVSINGQQLDENYLYNDQGTYGNLFLEDCKALPIPENKYFLMGDNRMASLDSRVIGLVDKKDIKGILKTGVTIDKLSGSAIKIKPSLSGKAVAELINARRREIGISSYVEVSGALTELAMERAKMIKNDLNGWRDGLLDFETFFSESKLKYLSVSEEVFVGQLSSQGLVEQLENMAYDRGHFIESGLPELGFATVDISNSSCAMPISVILIGDPSDVNFSSSELSTIRQEIAAADRVYGDLTKIPESADIDRVKLNKLTSDIQGYRESLTEILRKSETGEKLSENDLSYLMSIDEKVKEIKSESELFYVSH